jgi:tetratricopeptide (TPR) repeat protein
MEQEDEEEEDEEVDEDNQIFQHHLHHHQYQNLDSNSDATSSCNVYMESCKHCNVLSNQSKNLQLNYNLPAYLHSNTNMNQLNNVTNLNLPSNNKSNIENNNNNNNNNNSNTSKNLAANLMSLRKNALKIDLLIEQNSCLDSLMKLLKDLGHAFYNLKQFECEKALNYFELLPQTQTNSSFVLSNMAKAHFELHNYQKAEKIYLQLRRQYPYHLEGLECYSTTLWHLQKEIALSALAQELTEYDKLAPETWCVVGNCFSLHKEHDAAIKFFQRATQVDPKFVYAYNLLGHEYFLIEEMDKGKKKFFAYIYI